MKLTTTSKGLQGTIQIPGDKSISHRAVMFGAMANGTTNVTNFLAGEDCLSTIDCFRKLGVTIEQDGTNVTVHGRGLAALQEPSEILNVGNSGTTTRLLLGVLAGLPRHHVLIGDESIAKRPMKRVTEPLKQMGAQLDGRAGGNFTPISIRGGDLTPIQFESPVASAQVKSAILLAGLQANGTTTVHEPALSRDHTERLLPKFGVNVERNGTTVSITGPQTLTATDVYVPGDISSAAFFLVAAAIVPNSKVTLQHVGLNDSRSGIIDVLRAMGANVTIDVVEANHEPYGNITIETSQLKATTIEGDLIPRLIDEIPIIAVLASQAEGTTVIRDAEELRVKETDRIATVVETLTTLGARIEATEDGMIIHGKATLTGGQVHSFGDHRIGMMAAIAALVATEDVELTGEEAIAVSYPNFFDHIRQLQQ